MKLVMIVSLLMEQLGSLASYIAGYVAQKNMYKIYSTSDPYFGAKGTGTTTHTCTNSNSICTNFSYSSRHP